MTSTLRVKFIFINFGRAVMFLSLSLMLVPALPDAVQAQDAPPLIITEIMYDLEGSDSDREWVEIYNAGSGTVEIVPGNGEGSWRFFDGSNHLLTLIQGSSQLAPGSFAVLAANSDQWLADHPGITVAVFDTVMSLKNTAGAVGLSASSDQGPFITIAYDSAWGGAGNGSSLSRKNLVPAVESAELWQSSAAVGGTPGFYEAAAQETPAPPADPVAPPAPSPDPGGNTGDVSNNNQVSPTDIAPTPPPTSPSPSSSLIISDAPTPPVVNDPTPTPVQPTSTASSTPPQFPSTDGSASNTDIAGPRPLDDFSDLSLATAGESITVRGCAVVVPGIVAKRSLYLAECQGDTIDYQKLLEVYYYQAQWPTLNFGDVISVFGMITQNQGILRLKIKSSIDLQVEDASGKNNQPESVSLEAISADWDNTVVTLQGAVKSAGSKSATLISEGLQARVILPSGAVFSATPKNNDDLRATGLLRLKNAGWELAVLDARQVKVTKFLAPPKVASNRMSADAIVSNQEALTVSENQGEAGVRFLYLGAVPLAAGFGWVVKKFFWRKWLG